MRQRGDDTQHHSVPQLEWQHGIHCEDDEEEERHLKKTRRNIYKSENVYFNLITFAGIAAADDNNSNFSL